MNKIPTDKIAAVVDAIATVPGVHRVRQSKGKIIAFNLKPSTETEAPFVVNLNVKNGDLECPLGSDGVSLDTLEAHRVAGTLELVREAIAGAIERTEPEKTYTRLSLRNGRWVPARGVASWPDWRKDTLSSADVRVRFQVPLDGPRQATTVVWEGAPSEMPVDEPSANG